MPAQQKTGIDKNQTNGRMNTDAKNNPDQSDDIDLLVLIERSILFFRKYKWVFISAILVGLCTGFFFYRSIAKTYKSRLVVHSYLLTNLEEIQIVNNWNRLLTNDGYPILAAQLQCNDDMLKKVKTIKAAEIQQVFSPVNPNGFTIDVLVTDISMLDSLEAGILRGFENSEYVREKLAFRKANLQELIEKTTAELLKLDSSKKIMEGILSGKDKTSSSLIVDGSSINRQIIEINEKLLGFKESLKFTNAVQVLQSFDKFSRPDGPKLIPWLIIGLFGFLAIAYVICLVHSVNEKIIARSAQRSK
jgi:hypothetical protein